MSKRRRLDSATRILGDPERRERRNLSAFPGIGSAGGEGGEDPPPGGCPNAGPYDAGTPRCTIQSTSEVDGGTYEIIDLESKGLTPGADFVSYCFEGRVGPGTGPVLVTCDGKLGLVTDGLIHYEDWSDPQLPGWDGGWPGTRWFDDGPYYGYKMRLPDPGLLGCINMTYRGPSGSDEWDEACVKMRVSSYCATSRATAYGALLKGGYMGAGYTGFSTAPYIELARGSCADPTLMNASIQANPELTFYAKDNFQELYGLFQQSTGSPIQTTNGVHTGSGPLTIFTGNPEVQANAWQAYPRCGYADFGEIWLCRNNAIKFTGIPTGYYIRLQLEKSGWGGGASLFIAAETSGEVTIDYTYHIPPGHDPDGVRAGQWFQLWDGDPVGGGTMLFQCTPPRGFYPGDVWQVCENGDCATGDFIGDAQATIELAFLDNGDNVIETHEPTGTSAEAYTKDANTVLTGIGIPWQATQARFTTYKRGTADAFACTQNLQFNIGDICCDFTVPAGAEFEDGLFSKVGIANVVEVDINEDGVAEPHVIQVYDEDRSDGTASGAVMWTGEEVGDAWEEHENAPINLMDFDGHDEQDGPGEGVAGNPEFGCGYDYNAIDVDEFGIIPGTDIISVRFKGKVV